MIGQPSDFTAFRRPRFPSGEWLPSVATLDDELGGLLPNSARHERRVILPKPADGWSMT